MRWWPPFVQGSVQARSSTHSSFRQREVNAQTEKWMAKARCLPACLISVRIAVGPPLRLPLFTIDEGKGIFRSGRAVQWWRRKLKRQCEIVSHCFALCETSTHPHVRSECIIIYLGAHAELHILAKLRFPIIL